MMRVKRGRARATLINETKKSWSYATWMRWQSVQRAKEVTFRRLLAALFAGVSRAATARQRDHWRCTRCIALGHVTLPPPRALMRLNPLGDYAIWSEGSQRPPRAHLACFSHRWGTRDKRQGTKDTQLTTGNGNPLVVVTPPIDSRQ